MSYNTLTTQTADTDFQSRVTAATTKEAWNNPTLSATDFAALVKTSAAYASQLIWPCAVATEAQYASALAGGIPDPGHDESVITDADLLAAVQASWPPDAAP